MDVQGEIINCDIDFHTNKPKITFLIDSNEITRLEELKGKKLNLKINKYRPKRSLDMNAYMWELIKQISEMTDVEPKAIYRDAISYLDTFYIFPLRNDVVDRFEEDWKLKGDGWFCERFDSRFKGYTNVRAYYGSSTFDTKQMSKLIDLIIQECNQLGIETRPKEEIESMLKEWDKK